MWRMKSLSNYPCTVFSLASSLNFDYLDQLTDVVVPIPTDPDSLPLSLLNRIESCNFLEQKAISVFISGRFTRPPRAIDMLIGKLIVNAGLSNDRFC